VDVGIGLPSTIPGVGGDLVLEWARRAERRGFSSLGTLDRLVYDNLEPLVTLAAVAAVTRRIRLATTILIAPYRINGALLAKQAASIAHLSGGRLVLGVAVGGRKDDFEASGADFGSRGEQLDAMLEQWQAIWAGESFGTAGAIGPRARPELIIGGSADVAFARAARYGDGWIMGGGPAERFSQGAAKAREAWQAAGRDGAPRTLSLAYFALGERAEQAANTYLRDYYAFAGEYAGVVADGAAKDAAAVRERIEGFAAAGCDELVLFPCDPDPSQIDLLADAIA
jgi:alkanesulfonate monooxygenase SsuD/methylene tetrahydromethanopterin reductase-like flavin-dependent oxidoreductase (luciferase family)